MTTSLRILRNNQNRAHVVKPAAPAPFVVYRDAVEASRRRKEWEAKSAICRPRPTEDIRRVAFGTPSSRKRNGTANTALRAQVVNNFSE